MTEEKKVEEVKGTKLINGDVFVAMPVLLKLGELGFDVHVSIKLRQLRQTLSPFQEVIEDIRNGLVRKYGQEGLKGSGQLELIPPNDPKGREMSKSWPKYVVDANELMSKEIAVDFEKVKLPTKIDDKPIPFSANDMDRTEKFIEVV